jgi:hypothetical protein
MPASATSRFSRAKRNVGGRSGALLILCGAWIVLGPCAGSVLAGDDREARRAQIAGLQTAEQQELLRKQERFNALPAEEQDRLRALQAALDADQNAERLQKVLKRYHEWLKTLTPSQRAELADLPPQQRVEAIQRLQKQQQAARERMHRAELLSREDVREIVRWTESFVWARRDDLLASMSPEQRKKFEKMDESRQRRELLWGAYGRARREGGGGALASIDQADVDRLAAKLSDPAKQELAKAETPMAQRRVIRTWIGTAMRRVESWQAARKLSPLVGEELVQFLQNEVPPSQRDRLMKLPREEMLEELRDMYFERGRGDSFRGGLWLDGQPPDRPGGNFRGKSGRGPGPVPSRREPTDKASRDSD